MSSTINYELTDDRAEILEEENPQEWHHEFIVYDITDWNNMMSYTICRMHNYSNPTKKSI